MFNKSVLIPLIAVSICVFSVPVYSASDSDELFSPAASLVFYEIAHDIANSASEKADLTQKEAEIALIFLTSAVTLDNQADYTLPDMINLACHSRSTLQLGFAHSFGKTADVNDPNQLIIAKDNSTLVKTLLKEYVDRSSDLKIVNEAIQYLLSRLDSREQREETIAELRKLFNGKNSLLESQLATSLGLLASEKADYETAQKLFLSAFSKNRYNRLAFEKLSELSEGIRPATYLEQLRYQLTENPLNLQTAISFASYAQQNELFKIAKESYQYCADLYRYLYPGEPLPQYIYLPWALNTYSGAGDPYEAVQIANSIRAEGTVDIMLEAVASKAAEKLGDNTLANSIITSAESKVMDKLMQPGVDRANLSKQLAWLYCFGKEDSSMAIDWANKTYANEPNSPDAAALLAYAFTMSDQHELAQSFINSYPPSLVMNLAKAKLNIVTDQNDTGAIKTLKEVIASAPESIEAGIARNMLDDLGTQYIAESDPKLTRSVLEASFPNNTVPEFLTPDKIVQVQLKLRGNEFSYGSDFRASLVITNRSNEPLLISDNGLLQGNIRIDAKVSGDLNKKISNLITKVIRPSEVIDPDSSLIVPVQLLAGQLKSILKRYPQASLEIEFTVYVDAVVLKDGTVANRLEDKRPIVTTITRPGVELTAQFLRNRMNSLKRRRQSHLTAQMFAGLLIEQQIMANNEPLYEIKYADWMPVMLRSGLSYNLTSDDWPSRITTMGAMLDLPLDFELINSASENLSHEHWPVRLMALYLLGNNNGAGFDKVLDHTAKYDEEKLVRDMAVALGGQPSIE